MNIVLNNEQLTLINIIYLILSLFDRINVRKSFGTQNPICMRVDVEPESIVGMDISSDSRKLVCVSGGMERGIQIYSLPKTKSDKPELIESAKVYRRRSQLRSLHTIRQYICIYLSTYMCVNTASIAVDSSSLFQNYQLSYSYFVHLFTSF